jgi:hypothetical protein
MTNDHGQKWGEALAKHRRASLALGSLHQNRIDGGCNLARPSAVSMPSELVSRASFDLATLEFNSQSKVAHGTWSR